MPRQCILTAAERSALLAFPIEKSELIRLYIFSEQDLSVIKQRRRPNMSDRTLRLPNTAQMSATAVRSFVWVVFMILLYL